MVPDVEASLLLVATPERDRVLIAIVRLSEGDIDRLPHFAQAENNDYRDVLWWSEYPPDPTLTREKIEALIRKVHEPESGAT
jgi:hypothetical protein